MWKGKVPGEGEEEGAGVRKVPWEGKVMGKGEVPWEVNVRF